MYLCLSDLKRALSVDERANKLISSPEPSAHRHSLHYRWGQASEQSAMSFSFNSFGVAIIQAFISRVFQAIYLDTRFNRIDGVASETRESPC